jgi:flagellar basal body-associated protein FliL
VKIALTLQHVLVPLVVVVVVVVVVVMIIMFLLANGRATKPPY